MNMVSENKQLKDVYLLKDKTNNRELVYTSFNLIFLDPANKDILIETEEGTGIKKPLSKWSFYNKDRFDLNIQPFENELIILKKLPFVRSKDLKESKDSKE